MTNLEREWGILHNNIESYEKYSLIIKLVCVVLCVLSFAFDLNEWLVSVIILIMWLQDAIWKTFQQRLENRVLSIEREMKNTPTENNNAFQLYSQWQENRSGAIGTIKEYISSAIKPTVAYPYIVLVPLMSLAQNI